MFSSQYSAASRAKRSARSSSTPTAARYGCSSPNTSAKMAAEIDRRAGRLGHVIACRRRRAGRLRRLAGPWKCGSRSRAGRCRRHAAPRQARRRAVAGCRRRARAARCGRGRASWREIAVGGAVETGQPVDQATDHGPRLAAHHRARLITGSQTGIQLRTKYDTPPSLGRNVVPGPRRVGEVAA